MTHILVKKYDIIASSQRYGEATIELTLAFNDDDNTSTLTVNDDFVVAGQTTGYTAEGTPMANSEATRNSIKLYSLKALTKLGTNHIYLYRDGETEFNKQTRYICDLTFVAMTIKEDIYEWRKTIK